MFEENVILVEVIGRGVKSSGKQEPSKSVVTDNQM